MLKLGQMRSHPGCRFVGQQTLGASAVLKVSSCSHLDTYVVQDPQTLETSLWSCIEIRKDGDECIGELCTAISYEKCSQFR